VAVFDIVNLAKLSLKSVRGLIVQV